MAIVKIGWSGGKDSTTAVMKHIERGDEVKVVHYTPMFTKEIPLILKDHYSFILQTADYFRSLGAEVNFADKGVTYYEYVTHVALAGSCKGQIFGFPIIGAGMCGFKRDGNYGRYLCVMSANTIMRALVFALMKQNDIAN